MLGEISDQTHVLTVLVKVAIDISKVGIVTVVVVVLVIVVTGIVMVGPKAGSSRRSRCCADSEVLRLATSTAEASERVTERFLMNGAAVALGAAAARSRCCSCWGVSS